MKRAPLAV